MKKIIINYTEGRKLRKISVIITALIIFTLPAISSEDSMWTHIAPNNYVYMDTVMGTEDFYGYSFLLKSYNKGQYEPVNGKQIYYTLGQYQINCGKKTYKIGVLDSYGEDDSFINGDYNKYAEFQPIVEGTAISVMATKLCRVK